MWDDKNRLAEVYHHGILVEKNIYDHTDTRVKKTEFHLDGTNTSTYYMGDFERVIDRNGETHDTVYYSDTTGRVAKKNESGTYYFLQDHLGSTQVVTDENAEVVEETEYLPFGAVISGGETVWLYR